MKHFPPIGVMHLMLGIVGVVTASGQQKRSHLVSDHMVLGASLTAILATEIGLGLSDLKRALDQKRPEAFRILCVLSGKGLQPSINPCLSLALTRYPSRKMNFDWPNVLCCVHSMT